MRNECLYKKAKANNATKDNEFRKEKFIYNGETDEYICPAGDRLRFFENTSKNGMKYRKYKCTDCNSCKYKKRLHYFFIWKNDTALGI